MKNPFKEGSARHDDFNTMSDLKWHCTKCELKSGQAKTWQEWRQEKGIQIDRDENGNDHKRQYCPTCGRNTVHRKLKSLEILEVSKSRSGISSGLAKRVKKLYSCEEAILLRKLSERELEVDHRFPQVRWGQNEESSEALTDEQLKEKFMLLSRSNNLWKSRQCEACVKSGVRSSFPGIRFWYEGSEKWDGESDFDENGCVGCFWYNPYKWREELQKLIEANCPDLLAETEKYGDGKV